MPWQGLSGPMECGVAVVLVLGLTYLGRRQYTARQHAALLVALVVATGAWPAVQSWG
jgi:hypothetical protein